MTPHRMNLVEAYFHYGTADDAFPVPRAVEPGSKAIVVAKNTRAASGASGLTVWRLGDSHYHCVLLWSAPRNFYLHANTVAFGITPGKPAAIESRGCAALFNDMYYYEGKMAGARTYYAKVSCNYGEQGGNSIRSQVICCKIFSRRKNRQFSGTLMIWVVCFPEIFHFLKLYMNHIY